ncbi:hypothetical protein REPUB_Repub12eG0213700 [Reevesia pubescens]
MATFKDDSEEDSARLDEEYYGEADMSSENSSKYHEQVRATGGYDVDRYPGFAIGLIIPIKLTEDDYNEFTPYAEMAIVEYNNVNKTNFKFRKLLKGNVQASCGVKYYLTFEVENAHSNGGVKIETFQGLVWRGIPGENGEPCDKVLQCRIKPTT